MRSGTRESHDLSGSHRGWSPRAIAGAIFSSTVSIGIGACAAIAGIDAPMDRADGGTAPDDGGAVRDVADRDAEGGKPVVPIARRHERVLDHQHEYGRQREEVRYRGLQQQSNDSGIWTERAERDRSEWGRRVLDEQHRPPGNHEVLYQWV
jgi:hypothetical protein